MDSQEQNGGVGREFAPQLAERGCGLIGQVQTHGATHPGEVEIAAEALIQGGGFELMKAGERLVAETGRRKLKYRGGVGWRRRLSAGECDGNKQFKRH